MKKSFLIFLSSLILCGCGEQPQPAPEPDPQHEHVFSTDWKTNDSNHWHECSCGEKTDFSAHKDENKDNICDVCNKELPPILTLYEIEITTKPAKTSYVVGDIFDPTGMIVTAKYTDRSTKVVNDYSYSNKPLALEDKQVIITYQDKSASVDIVVKEPTPPLDEYTFTYDFNNDSDFSTFTNGCGFTDGDNKDELVNYFDSKLEYENLIDSIDLSGKIYSRKRTDDSKYYLQFGSQSSNGTLVWHSIEKIYYVEIEVINYTNGEYSADLNSEITIDKTKHSLAVESVSEIKKQTFSATYENGVNQITLSSSSGRVLLSKLTITWRG